jgi:hypothetical protein
MSLLDEIVWFNGEPLPEGELSERLERLPPGAKVTLSITRRDGARTMEIVLATDPGHGWQLSVSPGATRTQTQHLDVWLQE